jgi:glycerol kinase
MQSQADLLNCRVVRPQITETTALGAAYLAGLAVGYWKDIADIREQWQAEREFIPDENAEQVQKQMKGWKRAVAAAQSWSAGMEV